MNRRFAALKILAGLNAVLVRGVASVVALAWLASGAAFADGGNASVATPSGIEDATATALASVVARPGGLTADEVAERAVRTSLDLKARNAETEAAEAERAAALVAWIPRLAVSFEHDQVSDAPQQTLGTIVTSGGPTGPVQPGTPLMSVPLTYRAPAHKTAFATTIEVPLSDYFLLTPHNVAAATRSEEAASFTSAATGREVAVEARVLYYEWARARLEIAVAEQALEQSRSHLSDAQAGVAAGTASRADVLRIESALAENELNVVRARNAAERQLRRLRTAVHEPPDSTYEVGEDLLAELPPLEDAPGVETLVGEAFRARPEIKALDRTEQAVAEQARARTGSALPRIELQGGMIDSNPDPRTLGSDGFERTWQVGIAVSYSPNDGVINLRKGDAARARATAAGAERGAEEDRIRTEVEQAWLADLEARTAIRSTRRGLEAATESYRVRRMLFQNGRATSGELTDAETDLTRARVAAIDAHVDHRVARAKLLHATGRQ